MFFFTTLILACAFLRRNISTRFKKCSCFNSESELHEYINNMGMNPDKMMPPPLSQSAPDLLSVSGGPPNRPPPLPPTESETTDEAEEEPLYCNSELPQMGKCQKSYSSPPFFVI